MTNTVVVSDEITVLVQADKSTILTNVPSSTTVVTGQIGPRGRSSSVSISAIQDVDTTNLQSGSVLVYNAGTNKWVSTTSLSQQSIDCGEF
jgi:hypothetical protein